MKVAFTHHAETSLEEIGDFIALDNPARAASFIRELRGACLSLKDFPKRCPLAPRYEHLGIRRKIHGNYLIFYRIEGDIIEIIHITEGSPDYHIRLPAV